MVVSKSGTLAGVKRHDYLPFGEELGLISGRTQAMGYSAIDNVRQRFTQKERDIETGLDYFGARHFSSIQGRFISTDPAALKLRHLANPQDLNRYAYVANNPLKYIDPDGEEKILVVIESYIPTKSTSAGGRTYKGDDRPVPQVGQPQTGGTFRTQQIITIETDPFKNGGNPQVGQIHKDVGITYQSDAEGNPIGSPKQGSGDSLTAGVSRNKDGSVEIHAHGDESNPDVTSPGITYNYNINVRDDGKGGITVTVSGNHDQYPAHVVTASRIEQPKAQATTVYSFDPEKAKTTPYYLFPLAPDKVIKPTETRLP